MNDADTELDQLLDALGVEAVINAQGPNTRMSGGPMEASTADVVAAAAKRCFVMDELQRAAGDRLAGICGAEAGYITSGAGAALALSAAACVSGLNPAAMQDLGTRAREAEIVIQQSHMVEYSRLLTFSGATLKPVGYLGYPGGGTIWPWHIQAAIDERTAAVAWFAPERPGSLNLPEVVEIAHSAGVPVIVDASNELPPAANLREIVSTGADLVCFSGGKAIGGPQASGILLGRRDLIDAVSLLHQDMDVALSTWPWGRHAIDSGRLLGPPPHGVGRPMKVGKEQILGLLFALESFLAPGSVTAAEQRAHLELDVIERSLVGLPSVSATRRPADRYPTLVVSLSHGWEAEAIAHSLLYGTSPRIAVSLAYIDECAIGVVGSTLRVGEGGAVAEALAAALT